MILLHDTSWCTYTDSPIIPCAGVSIPRYSEDETSPLYCDPLHAEDYTYCILSKRLTRPAPKPVRTSAKTSQASQLEQETTDQPSSTT